MLIQEKGCLRFVKNVIWIINFVNEYEKIWKVLINALKDFYQVEKNF